MTSHEYATRLIAAAVLLEKAAVFELPSYMASYLEHCGVENIQFHTDKALFLAAVRAVGSGVKAGNADEVRFVVGGLVHLVVDRASVCKLVKPAEYECEPLLSQVEEAVLDGK